MTSINYQAKTCGRCDGTGKDKYAKYEGERLRCTACGGQGAVLVAQPAQECGSCGGTGVDLSKGDPPVCVPCWGTGWAQRKPKVDSNDL